MEFINEKHPQDIAERLYELAKGMDFMDYEEYKEEIMAELESILYWLKGAAQNEYNHKYFRTFWNILQGI